MSWSISSSEKTAGLSAACGPWRARGMRPVCTWKYTAASPTPMSDGPRLGTPSRFSPWQVMQLVSYSSRPAASAADGVSVSSAAWAGAKTEYRAPVSTRPVMRPATLASRRRCLERRRARARPAGSAARWPAGWSPASAASDCGFVVDTGSLADQVDRGEEPDPHDVDEVPVVGDHDGGGRLGGREAAHGGPDEHEDEGDEAADDVQRVEAGGQVEDRAVRRGRDRRVVVHDQVAVLVRLPEHERQAHREGDGEPAPQPVDVTDLRGEHAVLTGDRRGHQDQREDERVRDVELGGLRRPGAVDGPRARGEVHGEQAGEEHQLAGEPDDRADADHVRSG